VKLCPRGEHITPVLKDLGWCPIEERCNLKVLSLVYKALCGLAPGYLEKDLTAHTPRRAVRSSTDAHITLELGSARKKIGRSTFSTAGPLLWNALPPMMRILMGSSLQSFMSGVVKTFV
jgi:hypothetical protein